MPGGPPMSPRLPGPDGALSAPVATPVGLPPAANAGRPFATQSLPLRSSARLLILLVSVWGLGVAAHAPVTTATFGLAALYGLLYLILLPFDRWACFLVFVTACASELALRAWSPIRYNTLHYATFFLLPIAYGLGRPRAQMPKPLLFWFGICVWSVLSGLWSAQLDQWSATVTEYVGVGCLAFLTRQMATTPRRRREFGLVFAITSLAMTAPLLVVFGVGAGSRLGQGHGMNADGVASLAAMGILMLAMSAVEAGTALLSPANLALYVPLGVIIMLTQGRGGMLSIAGAALAIALGQRGFRRRVLGVVCCLLLGAGLVLLAVRLEPEGMQHRWNATVGKNDLSAATAGRTEIWRTISFALKDHWLTGVGAGQFGSAFQEYSGLAKTNFRRGKAMQAHNVYVNFATEGGLVAVVLMIGFYVSLWVNASRLASARHRAVARAIIVYVLIDGCGAGGLEKWNWLAIGVLLAWFWENRRRRPIPLDEPSRLPAQAGG
jgi:O-antigen ligase